MPPICWGFPVPAFRAGLGCCAESHIPSSHPHPRLPPPRGQTGLGMEDGGAGLHPCRAWTPQTRRGTHPNPHPRGSPAVGFQASRWRCATACRELPTHTRLRSRAPGMSAGKTLPVCAGLRAPSPAWDPSSWAFPGNGIFGRQVKGEEPGSGISLLFDATGKKKKKKGCAGIFLLDCGSGVPLCDPKALSTSPKPQPHAGI